MRFHVALQLTRALACIAILGSTACSSDSKTRDPQSTAEDASASRDADPESEKPRTSQKADERTAREAARDGGVSKPERDAAVAERERDAAVAKPERDAAAPATGTKTGDKGDKGDKTDTVDELDAGAELDAAAPELDAAAPDGGETDASLANLQASITHVDVSGTLCPEGSFDVNLSGDLASLTLVFAAAELQTSEEQSLDKDCDITLKLDVPEGFQVGKISVQPTGYVLTEQGSGSVELTHAFPASGASRTFSHPNVSGDHPWQFDDAADDVWSPTCAPGSNRGVEFTFQIRVGLQGIGYLNVNAIDLDLAALRGVTAWRACEMAP